MKVNLTLTDQRATPGRSYYASDETEDYERASLNLAGPARVVANALRALADDIDPLATNITVGGGGAPGTAGGTWVGGGVR